MDLLVAVAAPVVIVTAFLVVALPAIRQRRAAGERPLPQPGVDPIPRCLRQTWRSPLLPAAARPLVRRALEELGATVNDDGDVIEGVTDARKPLTRHRGIRYEVRVSNEPWGAGIVADLADASSPRPGAGRRPHPSDALQGAAARLGDQLRSTGAIAP